MIAIGTLPQRVTIACQMQDTGGGTQKPTKFQCTWDASRRCQWTNLEVPATHVRTNIGCNGKALAWTGAMLDDGLEDSKFTVSTRVTRIDL